MKPYFSGGKVKDLKYSRVKTYTSKKIFAVNLSNNQDGILTQKDKG